ncbi:peptidoglycan editing factor PgeF [Pelagibacteraceae bacterium]|nr:peptidoglycan editing factor PgeF [Pelagibacteraceae bacterium]
MHLKKNYYAIKKSKISHGFFTKLSGFSKKEFKSLNCSLSSGDIKNLVYKNRLKALRELDLHKKKLILINQIHSSKVIEIKKSNINKKIKADGMITSLNDVVLGILTADCAPIFLYDNKKKFICCLHSGWKGSLKNISKNALKIFERHNINRDNLTAIIGPCLSTKSYEVDNNFERKFFNKDSNYSRFFRKKNKNKFFFNLRGLIKFQLKELGLKNIYNINLDTYSNKNLFFSHRRATHEDKKPTGRLINLISLT